MVKQKVEVKLSMLDGKKRSKAMQCAAGMIGVLSLSVDGDKMIVVGDGIDAVKLTMALRKKLGFAELIKLTNVEENLEGNKPVISPYYGPPIGNMTQPYDNYKDFSEPRYY